MDVVTLNTSGGDRRRRSAATAVRGAARRARDDRRAGGGAVLSRAARHAPAQRARHAIAVADGGAAEWLPQETILFDRCALDRRLDVELAADAWFLGVESAGVRPRGDGRGGASTPRLRDADPRPSRRPAAAARCDPAGWRGGRDAAPRRRSPVARARWRRLVHVAPDAEAHARRGARCVADAAPKRGASAWDGMLVARVLWPPTARHCARGGRCAACAVLRDGRPLPRVWLC